MARVFVEKALEVSEASPFDLILMAAKRGRQLSKGAKPEVDSPAVKPGVIALHEIEEGKYTQDHFHGVEQTQYELDQQSQEDDDEYQSEESERSPE
jgi:DNA-directed RNA polymerase subunit omega|tara:strand:+ start:3150 stop:3437 length:288 start_codon:yes stop_codon:yes gene_type:complete